jgi:MFS family permease
MLLTDLAAKGAYGRAFGVERAGDNAGAIIGPLLAAALVGTLGIRHVILLAIVPGVLAAAAITIAAREAGQAVSTEPGRRTLHLNLRELRNAGVGRVLTPVAFFEFGNIASTLLILRATELLRAGNGAHPARSAVAATSLAILLYAAHNAAATLASLGAGQLVDRRGPRLVFVGGGLLYVAAYVLFAIGLHPWPLLLVAFALAGLGIGAAETAESSVIALGLPDGLRGNGFGVLGLTQSLGDLMSTLVVGLLWSLVSPAVGFGYAAAWMLASVCASRLLQPKRRLAP